MRPIRSRIWLATLTLAVVPLLGIHNQALAQPPTFPGPIVAMLQDRPVFFFAADVDKNLMSLHFSSDIFLCGGGSSFNLADITFVTTPSEVQAILALIRDDDGAVMIFNTSDLEEAFGPGGFRSDLPLMCDFINGPKKIAEGTVRRVSAFSGNSFSASWTGTITGTAGNLINYEERVVFTIDPLTGERTSRVEAIELH